MISIDEEVYKVKPFVEKNKYVVPVFYSDNKVEADYKITTTPVTLVIDRQGHIRLRHMGYAPGNEEIYKRKIQELLGFNIGKSSPEGIDK